MSENWILSRRKFLQITGTSAAGIIISPTLLANNSEKPLIRFGLFSDIHYAGREAAGKRFYRESLAKVQEGIDLMNHKKVDFVIELGDFKDQDAVPNEANTLKYLTEIESVFRKFAGPTYHVLGNHDMDGISKQQFLERVKNTRIPKTESYYSFNRNKIHFVVLDANFTQAGVSYDHGNFTWDDTFIPEIQTSWLKEDLKSSKYPVVVFVHQMLDDSKGVNQHVKNAAEVRQILEHSGKVLAVFQGHVHEERYNAINGIHYYSVNAVVDDEGTKNNAYQIVEVFNDGSLEIKGFRRASNHEFSALNKPNSEN
ncbi:MAG: metallophosphoesterase [Prolixibacteraceae bacterium]